MRLILEAVMPRWYEGANEASFKLASGGHVFQAASPWVFARPRYYLVSDAQKAELLARLGRWRLLLMIVMIVEMLLILSITLPMILWPAIFGRLFAPIFLQLGPGLFILILSLAMMMLLMPLFAVPQIYLARALRSVLADAPRTDQRITVAEQLPKIAASVSGKLLVVGLISGSTMIAAGILLMIDAFMDEHSASSAPSSATFVLMGGLLTAYFIYLLRLKAKSKHTKLA
jgi:hypothetical protein